MNKLSSSNVRFALISILAVSAVGCGGTEQTLKDKVLILAADSLITEDEWGVLTDWVKEEKTQLKKSNIDCFTDSTLRQFVLATLNEGGYPIDDHRVWKKPEVKIERVKFYLETSASMEGYFRPQFTDFRRNMSDLLTDLDINHPQALEVYTLYSADSAVLQPDVRKFKMDMAGVNIPKGRSSELHEIFRFLNAATGDSEISFLVSDGIMSLPSDQIKADPNREGNRTMVNEVLKADIKKSFNELKEAGYSVMMYAFKADFQGNYYTYQDYVINIREPVSRPYYLWCLGKTEIVKKMVKELQGFHNLKPLEQLELGLHGFKELDFLVFTRLLGSGEWATTGEGGLQDLEWEDPTQFTVGVDLSFLPDTAQGLEYIKDNLLMENVQGVELELVQVLNKNQVKKSHWDELNPTEKPIAEMELTHFLVFKITNMTLPKGNVRIALKRSSDDWVGDWWILDDRTLEELSDKTWGFEHLVAGMKEGYGAFDQRYFSFNMEFDTN